MPLLSLLAISSLCYGWSVLFLAGRFIVLAGIGGLELSELISPAHLVLGQAASLACQYQLPANSSLYSVKWYKDGQEFFRFMPSMARKFEVFDVSGVTMDLVYSDSKRIYLMNVNKDTEGVYRCEVSDEYPNFLTVALSIYLAVIAIPSGPHLTVSGFGYNSERSQPVEISDSVARLEVSCTLFSSRPAPNITWYINRQPGTHTRLTRSNNTDGTVDITSSLELAHSRKYFEVMFSCVVSMMDCSQTHLQQDGEVMVKCSAQVTDFFLKTEQVIFVNKNIKEKLKHRKEKLLGLSFVNEKSPFNQRQKNLYYNNNNFGRKHNLDINIYSLFVILFLIIINF